jgi:hypothetical protein
MVWWASHTRGPKPSIQNCKTKKDIHQTTCIEDGNGKLLTEDEKIREGWKE